MSPVRTLMKPIFQTKNSSLCWRELAAVLQNIIFWLGIGCKTFLGGISYFFLTQTKSSKNQLEDLRKLWTFVRHLGSATCFSYMANIMSNHSISKMNLTAFEKETVVLENLCESSSVYLFQKLLLTFFHDETILLFWLEVAFTNPGLRIHISNQTWHSSKNIFHWINWSLLPKGCRLCPWEFLCIRGAGHRGNKITGTADSRLQTVTADGGKMTECQMWAADQGY